ncbi:MAG: M16 family metallopeptidase [Bdellovibrionales bacterium]
MFKKFQLKNGMKVVLVESHKSPVLSIQMWVRTGSADEKKGEEGISHFIEHLVFKGSRRFKVGEIAAAVEGAGGELNAFTSFDQTVFYVTISKQFQNVGLEVISEMMGFPTFDEKEINNEREVVIEEIKRSNDSPHQQASRLLFSTVYKKHPYGIPVIGFPENITNVSREQLVQYYRARYSPQNMTLVVAGDFEAPNMRKLIQKQFGDFEKTRLRVVKRPSFKLQKSEKVAVRKSAFAETILHLAFPVPKAAHKDIAALEVFALILGQGESSRLNRRLRMNQHLVNFIGSSVFTAKNPGFLAISLSLNKEDIDKALEVLQDEVLRIFTEPPTDEEMRKAVTNLVSEQFYHQETVDGLARNYGHFEDLFGAPDYFAKFLAQVEKLTVQDVLKTARKHLAAGGFSIVVMTGEGEVDLEKPLKKWAGSLKKRLRAARPSPIKMKKGKAKPLSFIAKSKNLDLPKTEKWELANGVTVITRPSFDTPVVSVRCASLGGSRLETREDQGSTELLSRVWTAGCGSISEDELNHKTDSMAASLGAFGGRNSVGLSMTCLKPFLDQMLELYFLTWREPLFESIAIARETKAMLEHVKLRSDNPAQLCILAFLKEMFGQHPYGRDSYGDEASIARLNATAVRHAYRQKTGLAIVASGAFEPSAFRAQLEGFLKGYKPGPMTSKAIPILYPKKSGRFFQESKKEQSHIVLGYPGLTIQDPHRYVLQVMQAVLAGQGGRLFVELRDKASLAYSVAPLRMEGVDGGYFGAYIGCSPEKAETAIQMIQQEFNKLTETLISDVELVRAQRYLIGKHDIELQRNSSLTSSILFDHIYGIDYTETFKFADRVRQVTKESVQALARTLFNESSVLSVVGPRCPW